MGGVSPAGDRVLSGLWLAILVLLLMLRELYRPVSGPLSASLWWGIGWVTLLLVLALAVAAIARLIIGGGRLLGTLLAVLSILYLPAHGAMLLGVIGDGTAIFAFDSVVQAVLYPSMTVLALVILLGHPATTLASSEPTS